MKNYRGIITILTTLTVCAILAACGMKKPQNSVSETEIAPSVHTTSAAQTAETTMAAETKPEQETKTMQTTEAGTEMVSQRSLTEEEIQFFSDYLNRMDTYGFLLSRYDTPAEIDLNEVFYSGAGIQTEEMSEAEQQAFMETTQREEIDLDLVRLSEEQIDEFLLQKTGLTLHDMEKPLSWLYIEEYKSFYHMAGDTNYTFWICTGGSVTDEIYYTLYVDAVDEYLSAATGTNELTLKKSGENYLFISNKGRVHN